MSEAAGIQVLHVDDDPNIVDLAAEMLEREDDRFSVETATSPSDGSDLLSATDFDCIVSDYQMPGQNGIEFLDAIRDEYPDLPFILYTGKGSEEVASKAISAGVTDYLQKAAGTSQYTVLANRVRNAVAQYRSRRELEATKEKLSEIAEGTNDVLYLFNGDWSELLFVNSAYETVWGGSVAELRANPQSFLNLVHPEDREKARESMERISNGERDVIEYRILTGEDDDVKWIRGETQPILDNDGEVDRIVGSTSDITENKTRERELRQLKDHYQTFVEYSSDIITVTDQEGTITYESKAIERVLGYSPENRLGDNVFEYIHPEDRERAEQRFRDVLNHDSEASERTEVRFEHEDGSYRWLESIGIDQTESEIGGLVFYSREITERKEREAELGRQNERLAEFASVVAHDLRNPLNVAQARIDLAKKEGESEHLDTAAENIERSFDLIEDMLTLARQGREVSGMEPIDLASIVETCWENVETGTATVAADVDATIHADASRLRQLLENLMRNTVEQGDQDVTVRVGALSDGFYVEDDGPGIPEDESEDVFEPGYSKNQDGTGFGLAIVRQVAAAHDWELQVTEGADGGARFEFTNVEMGAE